jgi:hypothetical protein
MLYLALYWLAAMVQGHNPQLHQRPALIYSVGALLLGGQLLSIGFLAELITAFLGRDADTYSIAERTASLESPAHADAHESTHG